MMKQTDFDNLKPGDKVEVRFFGLHWREATIIKRANITNDIVYVRADDNAMDRWTVGKSNIRLGKP